MELERDVLREIDDVQNSLFKLQALEGVYGSVWIGRDVAIRRKIVINPQGTLVEYITVSKEDLPPLEITRGIFKYLGRSVRSFYAQTGIDIQFHRVYVSDEMLDAINSGGQACIPVNIINHGQRAVEIDGSFMRFFFANDRKRLRGERLKEQISSGKFLIEGEKGKDWFFGFAEDETGKKIIEEQGALCVVVSLREVKFFIPPDLEPIKKDPTLSTRADLGRLLVEIPPGMQTDFEIGETSRITLGENTVAVINLGSAPHGGRHITSPLIDPGFSGPIRTETVDELRQIDLFLYEDKR